MALSAKARLAFAVVQLVGTVKREVCTFEKGAGLVKKLVDEDAGYLVYFPKGHVLRLTEEQLKFHGLDKKAAFVDMSEMHDPNSSIGQLFLAQSQEDRNTAWDMLEDEVIALATAKSGADVLPEQYPEGYTKYKAPKDITARQPRRQSVGETSRARAVRQRVAVKEKA